MGIKQKKFTFLIDLSADGVVARVVGTFLQEPVGLHHSKVQRS
jgi:hypothetical protein